LSCFTYVHWGNAYNEIKWLGDIMFEPHWYCTLLAVGHIIPRFGLFCAMRQHQQNLEFHQPSYLDLLDVATNLKFSDARDYIYGLLGLRTTENDPDNNIFLVEADYGISAAVGFRRVAETLLLKHERIQVLSHMQHESAIRANRISWVPDWCKTSRDILAPQSRVGHTNARRPAKMSRTRMSTYECLDLRGIAFDCIAKVFRPPDDATSSKTGLS
jgi:hypothetical protein